MASNVLRMQCLTHINRMYGNSRNLPATARQSHRQFSDCAYGEPAYQKLLSQPMDCEYEMDSIYPESAEELLSSHRLVNDMRLIYMAYNLITEENSTECQHPVAFITLNEELSAREKKSLIHELIYLCGNYHDSPSKIFVVDWLPSSGEGKQEDHMMSE